DRDGIRNDAGHRSNLRVRGAVACSANDHLKRTAEWLQFDHSLRIAAAILQRPECRIGHSVSLEDAHVGPISPFRHQPRARAMEERSVAGFTMFSACFRSE